MRNLLEKAIVALINEENEKFTELMHQAVVMKSRQIFENIRQGDDVLGEDWDEELDSEHYMDGDDVADDEVKDDEFGDSDADSDAEVDLGNDLDTDGMSDDKDGFADDDSSFDADHDGDTDDGDLAVKLDSIEDKLEALAAQFDRLMDEEGIADDEGNPDEFEDNAENDLEDAEGDLEGAEDDLTDDDVADAEGDEDAAEDEIADAEGSPDEEEDYDDITESVISELEKISFTPSSKEIGTGKAVKGDDTSPMPMKKVGDRKGAKPVEIKAEEHQGFERETPKVKPGKLGNSKNANPTATKLKNVSKTGDGSAALNKDYAGGRKSTRSTVDGKDSNS